jgi:hypothetical protein
MAVIEDQRPLRISATLACFRWNGMFLFQGFVYVMLHKSTLVTLALAIDFGHGGASDAKYTLFSAGDTEHPGFLLDGDEVSYCFAAPTPPQCNVLLVPFQVPPQGGEW